MFRVVKPDGNFCFVDQQSRYYSDWQNFLDTNMLPQCKMCYPRNGIYKLVQAPENNQKAKDNFVFDLVLSESIACTSRERLKRGALMVVSYAGLVAGAVSIIAAPFTGGATLGAYAVLATTIGGWVGSACMAIGVLA